jgi:hypothetical protein
VDQDQAPGIPTDCALSRYIRAHIITRQLEDAFTKVSGKARSETQRAIRELAADRSDLGLLLSSNPEDWDATRPALLRRQAE